MIITQISFSIGKWQKAAQQKIRLWQEIRASNQAMLPRVLQFANLAR
jgi:hypothetical protein